MWSRERGPLCGDHPSVKALREAQGPIQPYQHFPDRFFPSSAFAIGRHMRYMRTVATVIPHRIRMRGPISIWC